MIREDFETVVRTIAHPPVHVVFETAPENSSDLRVRFCDGTKSTSAYVAEHDLDEAGLFDCREALREITEKPNHWHPPCDEHAT